MKRGLIALAALLAVPAVAHAQGTTTEVAVEDFSFTPANVDLDVGTESVHWSWAGTQSAHNVFEQDRIFESGNPATSGDLTITPSAGTFKYYCEPHGFISDSGRPTGMAGQVAVRPTATPQGKRTLITWATETTDTGNRYDVQRKVGKKKKLVEEQTKAIEGAFRIKSGKKYKFRVRSLQGKRASDWSPKLTLRG